MSNDFLDFRSPVDRSTLELWSQCPMQARLVGELNADGKHIVGEAANIGEEGHQAIKRTIIRCLPDWESIPPREFAAILNAELRESRPDVQPHVIEAFQAVAWKLGTLFAEMTAAHILRHDGGEGSRCGQLAWDIDDSTITSELDLLCATQAKTVLREHDWKSGWKLNNIDSVRDSLQFGAFHPVLVFNNYPECEVLEVAVWNTRLGQKLPYVGFHRSNLDQYEARIRRYLDTLATYERAPLDQVPCWASTEKCRICDVAARCPAVDRPLPDDDAEAFAAAIAIEATLKARQDDLAARVVKNGKPIVSPDGTEEFGKFGAAKPVESFKVRKRKAGVE